MKKELIDLLTSYLYGWKTLRDCAEWLASVNWDNLQVDSEILDLIGRVELIATEVIEGLRTESEFSDLANEIVSSSTDTYIVKENTSSAAVNNTANTADTIVNYPMESAGVGL